MKKITFYLLVSLTLQTAVSAQVSASMNSLGSWDDNSLTNSSGVVFNDIWGYAAMGREYALIGSRRYVHFMDVTDPASISEITRIGFNAGVNPSANSLWRDIKTYGQYAYSVADVGSEGLLVFDLGNLPTSVSLVHQSNSNFTKAHNIFIDEANARLYVCGVTASPSASLLIFDLSATPQSPTLMASLNLSISGSPSFNGYIHDLYVENNMVYCCHLQESSLRIYDMTIATAPVLEGEIEGYDYANYNHSVWVSGNKLVFADENHGLKLKIADLTRIDSGFDPIDDYFQSNHLGNPNLGSIPHNPVILGDLCIVSYYHDGVVVFDISDPTDVQRVAYYVTDPSITNYSGYQGCWGVYPFLPSGNIIASDVQQGLFVLELENNLASLPVEWGRVEAFAEENKNVRVEWTTLEEEENAGFTVQRENRNGHFEDIGFVSPNAHQTYNFIDTEATTGWNFYRIKQTDFDGSFMVSSIVSAELEIEKDNSNIVPNPVQVGGQLTLKNVRPRSGSRDIHLIDAQGRIVFAHTLEVGAENHIIDLPNTLETGVYFWQGHPDLESIPVVVVK